MTSTSRFSAIRSGRTRRPHDSVRTPRPAISRWSSARWWKGWVSIFPRRYPAGAAASRRVLHVASSRDRHRTGHR
ncbi:hypothetical protein ACFXAO_08980 [Streptomyces lavendulae]|uniref:hypothetical protein n=1 Tax=Streptomyces lavendulae TaxID=1914 RepID=UPI0036AF3383